MEINFGPLQIKANYVELVQINMVGVTEDLNMEVEVEVGENSEEQMKVVYPRVDEKLIEFPNGYKFKDSEVMLCLRCDAIFYNNKTTRDLENAQNVKQKGK